MDRSVISQLKPYLEIHHLSDQGDTLAFKVEYDTTVGDFVQKFRTLAAANVVESPLKVYTITHGFIASVHRRTSLIIEMKDEILKVEPKSVIILLDWGVASGGRNPFKFNFATGNLAAIAEWAATHFQALRNSLSPNELYIHGIGHSCGAHLMGMISRKMLHGKKFNRITGLDPAGAAFLWSSRLINDHTSEAMSCNDADFVDVIHTDGINSWGLPCAGTLTPLGHADFYSNRGHSQTGTSALGNGSHMRVLDLFLESIGNKEFVAQRIFKISEKGQVIYGDPDESTMSETIAATAIMGFNCEPSVKGLFYLKTTGKKPWIPNS